jgi:ribosomal protein L37AE/L43A
MCSYVPGGKSPNRMDALAWCFTDLFPERVRLTLAESIITQAEERQQAAEVDKVQKENLGKVVTVDNTKKCRECGSPLLVKRGPITHCNSCGAEFGQSPAPATGGRQQVMK